MNASPIIKPSPNLSPPAGALILTRRRPWLGDRRTIAGSESAGDIAATAAVAGLGYGTHRLVKSAGDYRKVGQAAAGAGGTVLKGRMATAIRKAMINAARRAVA